MIVIRALILTKRLAKQKIPEHKYHLRMYRQEFNKHLMEVLYLLNLEEDAPELSSIVVSEMDQLLESLLSVAMVVDVQDHWVKEGRLAPESNFKWFAMMAHIREVLLGNVEYRSDETHIRYILRLLTDVPQVVLQIKVEQEKIAQQVISVANLDPKNTIENLNSMMINQN